MLITKLILAIYLTGGQSPRGPELGSVKFQNTDMTLRNFFVLNSRGFYAMRYHKAQAITNFSFYIVRYLPQRVTEAMVLYLAYIRPFTTMLYYQRKLTWNSCVFLCHKCWTPSCQLTIVPQLLDSLLSFDISLFLVNYLFSILFLFYQVN
jgi:hypothetical protein